MDESLKKTFSNCLLVAVLEALLAVRRSIKMRISSVIRIQIIRLAFHLKMSALNILTVKNLF